MDRLPREAISELTLQRIYSEFLEMPGLRLTCQQAQRLWGLDEPTCRQLLDFLVESRFLCQAPHDMYARMTDGPADFPPPRMARVSVLDLRPPAIKKAG
jgi:hypothetical protein